MTKHIKTPLKEKDIAGLKAGDEVLLSGIIFTARDQAHLRMHDIIENGGELPVDIKGQVVYYCGPTPPSEGRVIGSCGPTTSSRMDIFTPELLRKGLKGMIGKGRRSKEVRKAIKDNGSIYFAAPAGAGAYLNSKVLSSEVVAFSDLGPEAIYRLEVADLPLVVVIDHEGRDIYEKFL